MAYRFTHTEKWSDKWFYDLKPLEKLLFIYLCDNCDIAGFIEINLRKWTSDINTDTRGLEGALKGLGRGLIYSVNPEGTLYVRNFLKHQKNYPLNPDNKAHAGIITRFQLNVYKFGFDTYNDFLEGAAKGLQSPSGNGIGNSISNVDVFKGGEGGKTWKNDYEIYLSELRSEFKNIVKDEKWIAQQSRLNPQLDVCQSMEKACVNFWATEAGWKYKKKQGNININWKSTLGNAITLNGNKVYKDKVKSHD